MLTISEFGTGQAGTTPPQYCFIVRMDVQHDKEALFNEIYDAEHIPEIGRVPGVRRITRYRTRVPHEPSYMAVYEIERPDVPLSPEWKAASDTGRWAPEVRPYTMNREHNRAICTRIGRHEGLTYTTRHLFLEMMDVEPRKEALFDEIYESERLPALIKAPGVKSIVRFGANEKGHPAYLALCEIERPDVPASKEFARADRERRWRSEILPYTYNRHLVVYKRIM